MRALIQRVKSASVTVEGSELSRIDQGLLTFLGIGKGDDEAKLQKLIEKISKLRIFEDEQGKMNLSLLDIKGAHLIVSQFTLYADTLKGNRPSFIDAAPPDVAEKLYLRAIDISKSLGLSTHGGKFQADMKVSLINDGPVTLWIEV